MYNININLYNLSLLCETGPLTNGVLRLIAGMIGKEWKDVAAQLNLKPMRIQAILRNHMNKNTADTRFDMLVTWAKRVPKSVDKVIFSIDYSIPKCFNI